MKGSECAIIDPGDAQPVESFLSAHGMRLHKILCTHHHWDHVTGVQELAKRHGCEVWSSDPDFARIEGATRSVAGKTKLWDYEIEVLAVPGHTLGQIAYYLPNIRALFPGDTLFSAGCGRLFEGTPEMMFHSLQKLAALPAETKVYFGHEYTLRNLDFVEHYGPQIWPISRVIALVAMPCSLRASPQRQPPSNKSLQSTRFYAPKTWLTLANGATSATRGDQPLRGEGYLIAFFTNFDFRAWAISIPFICEKRRTK